MKNHVVSVANEVYQSDERIKYYKSLFKSETFKSSVSAIKSLDLTTQAKAVDYMISIFYQFNCLSFNDLKSLILTRNDKAESKLKKLCEDHCVTFRNIETSEKTYKRVSAHLKRDKLSRLVKRHS